MLHEVIHTFEYALRATMETRTLPLRPRWHARCTHHVTTMMPVRTDSNLLKPGFTTRSVPYLRSKPECVETPHKAETRLHAIAQRSWAAEVK